MKTIEEIKAQLATRADTGIRPFVAPTVGLKVPAFKRKAPETEKQRILREHKYIESDIPVNSPYWGMLP